MSVKLIYVTPLWLIANGIRYSHDNHYLSDSHRISGKEKVSCLNCEGVNQWNNLFGNLECKNCGYRMFEDDHIGYKDFDLIKRVGFKMKHESVLEHSLIVLEIEASRALLQELSRHRIGISPTVKSTRYTLLKDLKKEKSFFIETSVKNVYVYDYEKARKYVVLTNNQEANNCIIDALENVRLLLQDNIHNDIVKYALPEAFKFKGQYSFNLRSLVHLLELRTNKDVLPEFQKLCANIIDVLPNDYKELVLTNEKIKINYERIKNG